jgi:hypothetical protein
VSLQPDTIQLMLNVIMNNCHILNTNPGHFLMLYEGVSKCFRTESITKYTLKTINTRSEATQRVMAVKLIRLTHKIAIQLRLVAESLPFAVLVPQAASPEIFGYTIVFL